MDHHDAFGATSSFRVHTLDYPSLEASCKASITGVRRSCIWDISPKEKKDSRINCVFLREYSQSSKLEYRSWGDDSLYECLYLQLVELYGSV